MECPNCGEKSKVVDSRKVELNVFRVRECKTCGLRFYTEETEIDTDDAKIYMAAIKRSLRNLTKNRKD